jgi:hypothetical protein
MSWDPEKYRREVAIEEIVDVLKGFLPRNPDTPKMPTHVCVEEAIKILQLAEDSLPCDWRTPQILADRRRSRKPH